MPVHSQNQQIGSSLALVTGSRSLNSVYHNTSGRLIIVMVTVQLHINTNAENARAEAHIDIQGTPPLIVGEGITGIIQAPDAPLDIYGTLVFAVPNGYYYQVVSVLVGAGATVTKILWDELTLIEPMVTGF